MSKKATEFQKREMSKMYRGKEIFKPLNTGWVDERVACVREWVANIFFYRKGDTTIMIDAGYNYDRLAEKMGWLGIDPKSIRHILITHQDTDWKTSRFRRCRKRCKGIRGSAVTLGSDHVQCVLQCADNGGGMAYKSSSVFR